MTETNTWIALLRAVNVGGTGKLPMAELRELCSDVGFEAPKTYIQSGNVVFEAAQPRAEVQRLLEEALETRVGKPISVMLREPAEFADLLAADPFPETAGNRLIVWFFDEEPAADLEVKGRGSEVIERRGREWFVHFPDGQARSKLRLPASAPSCTARNRNTVAKLVSIAESR